MHLLKNCIGSWVQTPRLLLFAAIISALVIQTGCRSDTEQARSQLNELGVRYSTASFFERIKRGDERAVELFLTSGVEPNAINSEGKSALVTAVRAREKDIVQLLLEEGADPNGRDRLEEEEEWTNVKDLGNSPLESAHWGYVQTEESNQLLRKQYLEIADLLLRNGANVDNESPGRNTPLISATTVLEPKLVDLYLKYGADVNHETNAGHTPLTSAVEGKIGGGKEEEQIEIIKTLLEAGADVGYKTRSGKTALMKTSFFDGKIVKILLENGANPNIEGINGESLVLKEVKSAVAMSEFGDDEGALKSEKALVLTRYGADISKAIRYLRDEGYQEFARKLTRSSKRSSSY